MNPITAFLNLLAYVNPWRGERLTTYIILRCLMAIGTALVVVSSIIFLIDYVEVSKSLGQRGDLTSFQIVGLLLLKSPNIILVLLPFAFLFGTLSAFVGLNRRSELIAMRAAGMSAWRFVLPATGMAAILGALTVTVLNPVATLLADEYDRFAAQQTQSDTRVKTDEVYLRQGDGKQQTVIRARTQSADGRLMDASFWTFALDEKEIPRFLTRIDASEAVLRPGTWQLKNARVSKPGESTLYYNTLSIGSNLSPDRAFSRFAAPQSTNFWQLPGTIAEIEASGFSAAGYVLRLHQLLATPLMFAAMTALGAAFSLRLMRIGGLARLTLSGIVLGFMVFFLNQLCGSLGKAEVIPVFLAGWATPFVAFLTAMTLLVYTEDG
ncbi:LptF/LptG family permease [Asticcacaulis sp. DW145]|jgi:lipopolysaccharide export system permease protein|uniref:LptF/LptG family permease n=1 Tax=Asticcacaulis currens TaxID=2984210 RepID=A0ABT5II78_9CAUL|nr:LptF/LptG family permease [Asticcacaulis currens]MDC7695901.1 LptF/LptG family permease [Asticcacaulis currens]BEV12539.1 LptF/LptG family permease [Asticcacaulis sp. DW145]